MSLRSVLYEERYKESLVDLLLEVGVREYDHGDEWVDYYKTYDFDSVNALHLVINEDNKVVASGGYKILPDGRVELVLFYTAKDYRGQGLARQIYKKCLNAIKDVPGVSMLFVTTHKEFSGYSMWVNYGFTEYNEDVDDFGNRRVFLVRYYL